MLPSSYVSLSESNPFSVDYFMFETGDFSIIFAVNIFPSGHSNDT